MTTEPNQVTETVSLWSYDVSPHTPSQTLSIYKQPTNLFFNINDKEPLILTEDGFIYNGELIEDAGKAYKLFMEAIPNYLSSNYKNHVDK